MNIRWTAAVVACALLLPGAIAQARVRNVTDADAPRALPAQGPVDVRWNDPAGFTEIRRSHNPAESRRGNWVETLARYLRERAQARLPAGERLEVVITDIERAGDFEPWHDVRFQDVRVMREIYPPRIDLHFRRVGADGSVLAEGERSLTDAGFMYQTRANDSDPLRYEKQLLDGWLRREIAVR
jgi:hypothetical protein